MVVYDPYRIRRRAASVPADDVSYGGRDLGLGVAGKVNIFASHAAEDAAAIAAASRRNDRNFLNDVNAKLANVTVNYAAPPPPPQSTSSTAVITSKIRKRPPLPPPEIRRSILRAPPVDDYEIAAYLERTPKPYVLPASLRASSVPPTLYGRQPTVPRWFPTSVVPQGRRGYGWWAPGTTSKILSADELQEAGLNEAVVGVAHTAGYGDIVIGIPYKKRFMFSAQRELDDLDTQSLPATLVSPSSTSFVTARPISRPSNVVSSLPVGRSATLSVPYSRASYAGPPLSSRRAASVYSYPVATVAAARSSAGLYDDVDDVISIKSYPGTIGRPIPRRPLAAVNKGYDLELELAASSFGDTPAVLPSASLAKNYKTVLERYSNGPKTVAPLANDELDRKYEQILSSYKSQLPAPQYSTGRISTSAPPTDYTLPAPVPVRPRKPEMSDTRKKLRELLCRTRNDPHYFDN